MSEELEKQLKTLIKGYANNNPAPRRCRITKVYEDKNHIDVETDIGKLRYVDAIGSQIIEGNNAVILYFDEDFSDYVVIADSDISDVLEGKEDKSNKVASWSNPTDNVHYPSEKLVKDSLNNKSDITHTHNSWISYGQVDSTSTATVFTATVPNVSELKDGISVMLRNSVVTSASGFTLNVNGLGAKPVYNSMEDLTRDTTIFNINYTMLFVYDTTRVENGCWICYRGYNSDTNTIGYQIRTNSTQFTTLDKTYRQRIMLQGIDGKFFPVNTSTSGSTQTSKASTMNTREFLINGDIRYYNSTSAVNANAKITANTMMQQMTLNLGYSFNNSNSALSLTTHTPVYMIAEPKGNGLAKLKTPFYTQTLPSTENGLIYIMLGYAYSETNIELMLHHPVFEYKDNHLRLYQDVRNVWEMYCMTKTGTNLYWDEEDNDHYWLFDCLAFSTNDSALYYQDYSDPANEIATLGDVPAVVNNLTSNSIDKSLSAYQGKVLKGQIDDLNILIGNAINYINL